MRVFVALWPVQFGMVVFPCSSRLSLVCSLLLAKGSWCSSSPPGEDAVSFLLVLSLLAVSSAPLGGCSGSWWRRLASLRPGPRSSLVWPLADLALFGGVYRRFAAVFAAFSELRGARQVERFTACSFRHLPHVVSHLAVASEFFWSSQLLIQEDAERRGLTQTALSGGTPGSSAGLPLRESVEERQVCTGVWGSLAVGSCRPLGLGVQLSAGLCQGTRTRLYPTHGKGTAIHHSTHTESAQHGSANTRVTRARGTRAHVGLLGS